MTDRDLLALMAAILASAEIDNDGGPANARHYVKMAADLLGEVDDHVEGR